MFVCFVAALASGFLSAPKGKPLAQCTPNRCGFLGIGYNIIGGDPDADLADPGWEGYIFDRDWIIANGQGLQTNGCSYDSAVSSISGGRSLQTSLSKTTKISGSAGGTIGGWGLKVAFTGSKGAVAMNKTAWSESTHFEEARATCELFVAKLPDPRGAPFKFTPGFEARVRLLPTAKGESSDKTLEAWMTDFGTHYTSAITMGGMYARRYTISKNSWNTYLEDAKKNEYSAEVGVQGLFSASTGAAFIQNKKATKAFEKAISGTEVVVLYKGGAPFVEGNLGGWAAELNDDALAPVFAGQQNVLKQITELLTPLNFPKLDPGVKATAEEFAKRLCTPGGPNLGYPKCTPFAIDPLDIQPISIPTGYGINSVAWARDGANVTTGDAGGFVQTWDVRTGLSLLMKFGPTTSVASVAYSPDGKRLAVGFGRTRPFLDDPDNVPQSVKILDTVTGDIKRTLDDAGGSLAYSSNGTDLASVKKDGLGSNTVVQIYKATEDIPFTLDKSEAVGEFVRDFNFVSSVAYSPDGTHLAQTFSNLKLCVEKPSKTFCVGIQIWNTATGEITRTLGLPCCLQGDFSCCIVPPVYSVAYSPSGFYLASGSSDGTISIWSTTTGTLTRKLAHGPSCSGDPPSCSSVNSVAYSPDGKHIASGGTDGTVKTWNAATGELTRTSAQKGVVNSVAYSRDGKSLASGRTISTQVFATAGSLTIDTV